MLTDEDFAQLSDDPRVAMMQLAEKVLEQVHNASSNEYWYKARTGAEMIYALLDEHELRGEFDRFTQDRPPISEAQFQVWWRTFATDLQYYRTRAKVRRKSGGPLTVVLNDSYRKTIHELIDKIRGVVAKLEITPRKRDAILGRLGALAIEIDKSKTNLESFFALMLDTASTGGEAAKKLDPLMELLERLGKLFSGAKSEQSQSQLPAPEERKRIEGPRKQIEGPRDDEEPPGGDAVV